MWLAWPSNGSLSTTSAMNKCDDQDAGDGDGDDDGDDNGKSIQPPPDESQPVFGNAKENAF